MAPSAVENDAVFAPAPACLVGGSNSGLSVPVFVNHEPCCPPPPRPGSTRAVGAVGGDPGPVFAGFFARNFSASAEGVPAGSAAPETPFAAVTSFAIFCHGKRISTPSASSTSERKICGTLRYISARFTIVMPCAMRAERAAISNRSSAFRSCGPGSSRCGGMRCRKSPSSSRIPSAGGTSFFATTSPTAGTLAPPPGAFFGSGAGSGEPSDFCLRLKRSRKLMRGDGRFASLDWEKFRS